MSLYGKMCGKLNKSKNAAVSLDSLLDILSSAYGIECLNSKIVMDKNTLNLKNLSLDNFKAYSEALKNIEKEDPNKKEEENGLEETGNINVATSTSYLKSTRSLEDEMDLTLLSIKSSENLKISQNEPSVNKDNLEIGEDDIEILPESDSLDMINWKTICGFFIDDVNKHILFDIQFSKKNNSNAFSVFDVEATVVTICVVDSTKQNRTMIEIPKYSLVSKMEYFAGLDKEFGLESLNVMVKCNIFVFQWLVQWLTADRPMCKPTLNVNNFNLILSFAYHLGAHQLVEECLDYFSSDFDTVMKTNFDIEYVFDDFLLFKLVVRFSNAEIENISDDYVIFKERMFYTLITLLADKKPSSSLGHYASLANLFQCEFCEKLLTTKVCGSLPCRSDRNQFSIKGELLYLHELSPSWNISKYIELIYEDMKNWRMVYWRLWGLCHFLNCEVCNTSYPLTQADWCVYHSQEASYFPLNQRLCYPIGTYNCCGEITFMFNVLKRNTGCSFRPHRSQLSLKSEISAYKIYEMHKPLISYQTLEKPPVKKFYKLLKRTSDNDSSMVPENMWWYGFQLAPKEKRDYSLIQMWILNTLRNKSPKNKNPPIHRPLTYKGEVDFGSTPTYSGEVESSVDIGAKSKLKTISKKPNPTSSKGSSKKKKSHGCLYLPEESLWQKMETNKDNQDTQRDFEEIAMRNLVKMLTTEDQEKNKVGVRTEPMAGTYVRLESDFWHEYYKNTKVPVGAVKQSSVINRTCPLSWFRKLTI